VVSYANASQRLRDHDGLADQRRREFGGHLDVHRSLFSSRARSSLLVVCDRSAPSRPDGPPRQWEPLRSQRDWDPLCAGARRTFSGGVITVPQTCANGDSFKITYTFAASSRLPEPHRSPPPRISAPAAPDCSHGGTVGPPSTPAAPTINLPADINGSTSVSGPPGTAYSQKRSRDGGLEFHRVAYRYQTPPASRRRSPGAQHVKLMDVGTELRIRRRPNKRQAARTTCTTSPTTALTARSGFRRLHLTNGALGSTLEPGAPRQRPQAEGNSGSTTLNVPVTFTRDPSTANWAGQFHVLASNGHQTRHRGSFMHDRRGLRHSHRTDDPQARPRR